jgi:hypothetical protein
MRALLVCAMLILALAGCSSAEPAAPAAGEAAPASDAPAGGCPLDVADVSAATSLTWELQQTEPDYPLETVDGVTATVCLFTAADRPQFGDPLVMRVDTVTGAEAATLRDGFEESCTGNGGTVEDAGGVASCRQDGTVVDGAVASDGRTVHVYLVNADTATATELTPAFEQVLAAVR